MKRKRILLAPLLLCLLYGWKPSGKITLNDAIARGWVAMKLKGSGGHSGKCVEVEIHNLRKSNLDLVLEAGGLLNSLNNDEQDLLVVHEQSMSIASGQTKKMKLEGFCCQLHNQSPGLGAGFALDKKTDPKLRELCRYVKNKPIPHNILQEAIWCVSDGSNPANISVEEGDKNTALLNDLRKFVCKLTNRDDPWYNTPQVRTIAEDRAIVAQPVEVYGDIKYTINATTPVDAVLISPDGETVCNMKDSNPMPAGTYKYKFHLKVSGFPKGKYHVVLKAGTEQLMDKEFVI